MMRNLLTFSASAVIHSLIAIGVGTLLLTENVEPLKTKNISEVLEWKWIEEVQPPPVVAIKEAEPVISAEPIQQPAQLEPVVKTPPKPEPIKQVKPKSKSKLKKARPKPKSRKKHKPRSVAKQKVKRKSSIRIKPQKPTKIDKPTINEPLFKNFSGQNSPSQTHVKKSQSRDSSAKRHDKVAHTAKSIHPPVNSHALAKYKKALRAAIERHKKYPRREQRMGITGTVVISFQVNADGRLSNIRVSRSSGNGKLDAAARAAVEAVGRYQAPPHGQSFSTSVSVGFVLR